MGSTCVSRGLPSVSLLSQERKPALSALCTGVPRSPSAPPTLPIDFPPSQSSLERTRATTPLSPQELPALPAVPPAPPFPLNLGKSGLGLRRTRTRTNTNPCGTEANAADRSADPMLAATYHLLRALALPCRAPLLQRASAVVHFPGDAPGVRTYTAPGEIRASRT